MILNRLFKPYLVTSSSDMILCFLLLLILVCCIYNNDNNTNFALAGTSAYSNAYFGRGTGGIYLDNVGCRGSESRLIDCSHNVIGVHNCDHSDDAGIRCRGKAKKIRTWKIVAGSNIMRAFFFIA